MPSGGIIMLLSLLLFESEFRHIVAISFTALVVNELIMVALEITTWHLYMVLSELGTAVVYFGSMAVLPAYFGEQFTMIRRCLRQLTASQTCTLCSPRLSSTRWPSLWLFQVSRSTSSRRCTSDSTLQHMPKSREFRRAIDREVLNTPCITGPVLYVTFDSSNERQPSMPHNHNHKHSSYSIANALSFHLL